MYKIYIWTLTANQLNNGLVLWSYISKRDEARMRSLTDSDRSLENDQLAVLVEARRCLVKHTPEQRVVFLFVRERCGFLRFWSQRRLQSPSCDVPSGLRRAEQNLLDVGQSHFSRLPGGLNWSQSTASVCAEWQNSAADIEIIIIIICKTLIIGIGTVRRLSQFVIRICGHMISRYHSSPYHPEGRHRTAHGYSAGSPTTLRRQVGNTYGENDSTAQ